MCGRFVLDDKHKRIYKRYKVLENAYFKSHPIESMYNIAPGFLVPVITKQTENTIELMKWGLVPSWAKDPNIGYKMINARSDSIVVKPSYKNSFKHKRCLVPATGFYEWQKTQDGKIKIPYLFKLKSNDLFSMAGLYDTWRDAEGKELKTFTIITTKANNLMAPIHDRMPVILNPIDEDKWLDINSPEGNLLDMLVPSLNTSFETYPVSQMVNSPKNQGAELLNKVPY